MLRHFHTKIVEARRYLTGTTGLTSPTRQPSRLKTAKVKYQQGGLFRLERIASLKVERDLNGALGLLIA